MPICSGATESPVVRRDSNLLLFFLPIVDATAFAALSFRLSFIFDIFSINANHIQDTQVRWGPTGGVEGGLGFSGELNKQRPLDREFLIGRLTYFNKNTGESGGRTDLTVQLRIPEFAVSVVAVFTLNIDETTNSLPCAYPSTTPCADKVSIDNSGVDVRNTFQIG